MDRNIYIFLAGTAACILGGVYLTSLYVPDTWPTFAGIVAFLALLAGYLWLNERHPMLTGSIIFVAALAMAVSYSFAAYRAANYPELFFDAAKAFEGMMTMALVSWSLIALFLLARFWRAAPTASQQGTAA